MALDLQNSFNNTADESSFTMPQAWLNRFVAIDNEMGSEAKVFSLDSSELYGTHGRADDESESVNGIFTGNTAWRDRVAQEQKVADRNKNDSTDIAVSEANAIIEKNLERMQQVTYSNGQYTMYGITVDEEDLEASIKENLEDIDGLAKRHDMTAAEAQAFSTQMALYLAADKGSPKRQQALEKMGKISKKATVEVLKDAESQLESNANAKMNSTEKSIAETSQVSNESEIVESSIKMANTVGDSGIGAAKYVEENIALYKNQSVGDNPFANVSNASSDFNPAAQGTIQTAEVSKPDIPTKIANNDMTLGG
jgi:hypothetical protein